jgi:hypothetical protein
MQDQPVMRIAPERLGDDPFEFGLDRLDILARRQAGAVADAKDMRVDRERLFTECGIEHDVGGFAADPWKRLQVVAGPRDLPAEPLDQRFGKRDDVPRLGVEQADGLDCVAYGIFAELNHLLGRLDPFEQWPRRDVDAGVGCLRREHYGDEELVWVGGVKFGRGRGVRFGQPPEEFENLGPSHSEPITSRIE